MSFVTGSDQISLREIRQASSNIKFGLCCINHGLRHPDKKIPKSQRPREIFPNRTCASQKLFSVEKAKRLALLNLEDTKEILKWNSSHGISHYRISSDMFSHYTDPESESYTLEFARSTLAELGLVAKDLQQRITAHPGQYVQIGAKDPQIFEKSVDDLQMHTDILNMMNIPEEDGIICIHGGGIYGDKEATIRRWIEQFDDIPSEIQRRIAIEHCEKCYSIDNALLLSEETGIPVIYDNLHYDCYNQLHPDECISPISDVLPQVVEKWKDRGTNPVFHLAQQKENGRLGAHADFVDKIPDSIFEVIRETDAIIHLEVEAKMKEQAIQKLQSLYL